MSPSETATTNKVIHQPFLFASLQKKLSRRNLSKEKAGPILLRAISPFTPWDGNESTVKKRKTSLKGAGRLIKTLRTNGRDNRKRSKAEKFFDAKTHHSQDVIKTKQGQTFLHHHDINKYIKEYRKERLLELKQCNSAFDGYGPEDISKAYEGLSISKSAKSSRLSDLGPKGFLPPVQIHQLLESENFEVESEEGRADLSECPNNKFDDFDDDYENELSSHETRERRKNLNLSPLRKEVRLPDMYNSPVQAGSGIDLLDLAKLAEERTESTDFLNKSDVEDLIYKHKIARIEKKASPTPLKLPKKVTCRIVELSLPASHQVKLKKSGDLYDEEGENKFSENKKQNQATSERERDVRQITTTDKTKSFPSIDPKTDLLNLATSTSGNFQSSVQSSSSSSSSPISKSFSSPTVKEMLTASVKNLHKFSKNKLKSNSSRDSLLKTELQTETFTILKQLASIQPCQKINNNQSTKKHTNLSTKNWQAAKEKNPCLDEKKSLPALCSTNSQLPALVIQNSFKERNLHQFSSQEESIKLRRKAQRRQEAEEKYEKFKRALAFSNKPNEDSKLAIISKCQTVVKPVVTVRGVTV